MSNYSQLSAEARTEFKNQVHNTIVDLVCLMNDCNWQEIKNAIQTINELDFMLEEN